MTDYWEKAGVTCEHCGAELVKVMWGCGLGHPVMGSGIMEAAVHYCEENGEHRGFRASGVAIVKKERAG